MATYSDFVRDGYQRPIPGATAKLFSADGLNLIATATTGADGQFTLDAPDGKYVLQVSFGGVSDRSSVIVGNPPEYIGPPGASNNTYATVAGIAGSDIGQGSAILAPSEGSGLTGATYTWKTGNYTGRADVIASNSVPINQGAWVLPSSSSVTFATAGSPPRPSDQKLVERVSARDHGLIGDGSLRQLFQGYATLQDAQRVYPFATSLNDALDWAAIQKTLNIARDTRSGNRQSVAYVPSCRAIMNRTLRMASNVWLKGDVGSTILDNQNLALTGAQLTNDDPVAFQYSRISGINFNGGRHGILIDASTTEGNTYEDLGFVLQTASNFQTQRLLQTTTFTRCTFQLAPYGLVAPGGVTNHVSFKSCEFNSHTLGQMLIDGGEGIYVNDCRMEAGGSPNKATISLNNVRSFSMTGGYIEGTNEFVLSETGSTDTVSFTDVHFTGASDGVAGFIPYKLKSDGLITVTNSHGSYPIIASENCCLLGSNPSVIGTTVANIWRHKDKQGGSVKLKRRNPRGQQFFPLLRFTLPAATGVHGAHGTIAIQLFAADNSFGTFRRANMIFEFSADNAGATMDARVTLMQQQGDLGPMSVTIEPVAGATATQVDVRLVVANASLAQDGYVQPDFTYTINNSDEANALVVTAL